MIKTQVFSGTQIAEAKVEAIRQRPAQRQQGCWIVRDAQSGPALAYAARLMALGQQAGIVLRQVGYDAISKVQDDPAQEPAIFLRPAPDGINIHGLIAGLGVAQDAEGLHPTNLGNLALGLPKIVPPTARAVQIVARHLVGTLSGKRITIVGASKIVGVPLAQLLLEDGATVRIAQVTTVDLHAETQSAEVLISATGVPDLIRADHIAQGACVIDVGVTQVAGKLVGDVERSSVLGKAAILTHVPDGVGPVTAACLLENILTCTERGTS